MDTAPTEMIVTLDGSRLAEAVLPYVRVLAAKLCLPVELISVVDLTELARSAPGYEALFLDQLAEDATRRRREYLESSAQGFANGKTNRRILKGNTESGIVEYAARNPDAMIAMATHGRSGLNRWLLGSVTEKVLRSTRNPLLLIRATATTLTDEQATIKSIMRLIHLKPTSISMKRMYAQSPCTARQGCAGGCQSSIPVLRFMCRYRLIA